MVTGPLGALLPVPVCGPTVTAEPSPCGSLTWLFPRYVQEVIQRGRSCVRPVCTPVLSVVPAVSDLELSETEYVRPPRVPVLLTQTARGPGLRWSRSSQDRIWGAALEEMGLGSSFVSPWKETQAVLV